MMPVQDPNATGPMRAWALGALGIISGVASGRAKADITEAEGRLHGGLGAKPTRKFALWGQLGPVGLDRGASGLASSVHILMFDH